MAGMSEADWEAHALDELAEWSWQHLDGPAVAPRTGERPGWDELILTKRLRAALGAINPDLPPSALDAALAELLDRRSQDALHENHRMHGLLTRGVRVSYTDEGGTERHPTVWAVDFNDPYANEFLAVNQVRLADRKHTRRFDIVCYVNGLPLAVFELKRADTEDNSETAYRQLQTYRREFGVIGFAVPIVAVVSDGVTARAGTPFSPWEHMAPWNVDEQGKRVDVRAGNALEVLITGMFAPERFLDLIADFVSFSADNGGAVDTVRLAKAHQFHAVNQAVAATVQAVATDGRAGVVWHTQGSGKSKEMEFYTAKVARHPALANPTVLMLTDRIDLDSQLYETFSASTLLPERPKQALTRAELRTELDRPSGGIIFSTLQKFSLTKVEKEAGRRHPVLSPRRNLIVVVDEAHRSHYDFIDGLARALHDALPHASFIAFTGTPISRAEANTEAVFGDYIDIYDLTRAVDDGATVPVFYENRHIPVHLPEGVKVADLDERVEDLTADLDSDEAREIARGTKIYEDVVGAPERLRQLAEDSVEHWEARREQLHKLTGVPGKGMIVGYTRRICALLYDEIIKLRPEWASADDGKGIIKVAYTGTPGEKPPVGTHVRTPAKLKAIKKRVTDPDNDLELVIVQSLWLTGFDAPPLHTLYLDKPMRGASLMQALARVNRRFGEKPSGLVVDYLGIAEDLTRALAEYTVADRNRKPIGRDTNEILDLVRELHSVLVAQLADIEWRTAPDSGRPKAFHDAAVDVANYLKRPEPDRLENQPTAQQRFTKAAHDLLRAFALRPKASELAGLVDDIAFFETVRVYLAKWDAEERAERGISGRAEVEFLVRQLTAGAVAVDDVVDIYAAAGLEKPDLSHLDEAFVARLRESRRPELALEALRRAIEREIRAVHPHNLIRQRTFSGKLLETMRRYTNGALASAEIIAALVDLAKEVSADRGRAKDLGLTEDELAFYDAVANNESAVRVMTTGALAEIARDLVTAVRVDRAVDWSVREQVQARLRSKIKRLLARHGYPPDAEARAVELVLRQAETFAEDDAA
ncbi:type I restriction endonuclease subunit R [Actinophytocola sp.]|uniref:type I restriction endonuclease subunit R n=1 Tax=Actinophytocola sp. TaxID=1872138 RepID=UPI0025B9270F|nr:type I restriction endonuclease subunit R [Actinophytocola sp.]